MWPVYVERFSPLSPLQAQQSPSSNIYYDPVYKCSTCLGLGFCLLIGRFRHTCSSVISSAGVPAPSRLGGALELRRESVPPASGKGGCQMRHCGADRSATSCSLDLHVQKWFSTFIPSHAFGAIQEGSLVSTAFCCQVFRQRVHEEVAVATAEANQGVDSAHR